MGVLRYGSGISLAALTGRSRCIVIIRYMLLVKQQHQFCASSAWPASRAARGPAPEKTSTLPTHRELPASTNHICLSAIRTWILLRLLTDGPNSNLLPAGLYS